MLRILLFCLVAFATSQVSLAQCDVIYVSPSGSGLSGTIQQPSSLLEAFTIYSQNPDRNLIYVQEGQYVLNQKLTIPTGITIEGGFTTGADGWIKNSASISQIVINSQAEYSGLIAFYIGLELFNVNDIHIEDLTINVLPGGTVLTSNRSGATIYGVYARNSQDYRIERCIISTGNAANGGTGLQGANGNAGGAGSAGQGGCSGCNGFGAGGPGGLGANAGGNGGTGGYGDNNGQNGAQGAGPAGGNGGTGGSGDGSTCAFGCSNGGTGGTGMQGNSGANGGNGAPALAGSYVFGYYQPGNGTNGANGISGSGGGGGGGGGGTDCCLDDRGGGGGGGGAGGAGGIGGEGGGGGGGAFAFFTWNNGASAQLIDVVLNPGSAGIGAIGGTGGAGGAGGAGGSAGPGADNGGPGGPGGSGGAGGSGGTGGNGANGVSQQTYINGVNPQIIETTWPSVSTYQASFNAGCTNSVIGITKTSGTWNLNLMGAALVNDLGPDNTSFTLTDNYVEVFYQNTGSYTIANTADQIQNFIEIREVRELPIIAAIPDTICSGELLNLSTVTEGTNWNWTITNDEAQVIQQINLQNPQNINLAEGATYTIALEVKDACCGWSIPVFDSVYVRPFSNLMESLTICEGESVVLAGAEQTQAGVYMTDTVDANGCDAQILTCLFVENCTEGGCTDPNAVNYDPLAITDDGSCAYGDCSESCGPGTYWDDIQQLCLPFCREDLNNDGLVNTADLLQLLAMYGTACP
jgi:hypothetical protein